MSHLAVTSLVAFALALAVAYAWARAGRRIGFLDKPGNRSSHTVPTPRGGGIGIVIGLPTAVVIGLCSAGQPLPAELLPCLAAASLLAAISFFDDFRPMAAKSRLVLHVALAGVAVWSLAAFESIDLPWVSVPIAHFLAPVLATGWLLATINLTNFMDGIDGIAGVQAGCVGAAWLIQAQFAGDHLVSALGAATLASAAGFLVVNWQPAKVFLGDVGSAYLGLVFGCLPLVYLSRGNPGEGIAVFSALAVWPFLADGFFTLVRRIARRENIFEPHRSHLYQRLVIAGWSHAKVSCLYAAWGAYSVALGLFYLTANNCGRTLVIIAGAGSLVVMARLVARQESRARIQAGQAA